MRKPLIAGNWKLNKGGKDALELSRRIKEGIGDILNVDVLICPPFTALAEVHEVTRDSPVKLGAQDCFYEMNGAYTGEISPLFLLDVGCEYVILGHSERRKYFAETGDIIGMKLRAAIGVGLYTILCVGEKSEERESGGAYDVVKTQLGGSLSDIPDDYIRKITIAYEPVWAIGTGKTCDPDVANEMHQFIREWTGKRFGYKIAEEMRILYGGSIKPENISSLIEKEHIDGGLVGGASLKAESFLEIIRTASEKNKLTTDKHG
ncbi:triose-phosphate isomerase [candidate division WOR-3 bacterium JGI_Cruoil_03_44_89]|uniref:Triosephosphate isomerase n=1 Tax=candidate division WOR-3 bacterium JGI_Cruoil_03_44_89 TaxID=1973748 RepID=A0A235BUD0_UNCW3|nr:MAG: triose-phosphate isomerase [candidate division WOR-3 bacterium JGI_Cruoil_03_44_89]